MDYIEVIDDKAVEYIQEVKYLGGTLSWGDKRHGYLINTSQTLLETGMYNNEPNKWHEGKRLAYNSDLIRMVKVGHGDYFKATITQKGLEVLEQLRIIKPEK